MPARHSPAPVRSPLIPADLNGDEGAMDPLEALGFGPKPVKVAAPKAAELVARSPLNDHYVPPSTAPLRDPSPAVIDALIPDDYDPLKDFGAAQPSPSPTPASKPAARPTPGGARPPAAKPDPFAPADAASKTPPAAARVEESPLRAPQKPDVTVQTPPSTPSANQGSLDFAAMLAAAGLQGVQVTPELAANFGRILNVVVTGLMDVLRARERIKDEFRIRATTFKPAANNPLKFSANVEDALHNLLIKRNPAYLGPIEAFEDAFDDIRNHQLAMLAGLRVAFDAMLAQFDPEQLQEGFDKQLKKGSLLAGPARLRYWELYRDTFAEMTKDPENAFGDLFGDEFARAYGEQMDRLKAERAPRNAHKK
jgi:type VI secretion system FHA domain protein